jgi:site-specific DNA-methyltransferase (adenine-specific)
MRAQGKPKYFNRPRVPIPVCRHCGGDIKDYGGHRNKLHPDGLNLTDVWTDIPPVRQRKTKRRGANELSTKLLRRVLEIASEQGIWCLILSAAVAAPTRRRKRCTVIGWA